MLNRLLKRGSLLVALLAVALVAACSDSNEPNGDTQFRLENESGETILFVFFSECDDPSWGSDRLGSDEVVEDGEDRLFDIPNEGCWDFRVVFADEDEDYDLDVQIDEGDTHVWTVTAGA